MRRSQRFSLGSLLLHIDLIDLFYECEDSNIAGYADDATPYSCGENIQAVVLELKLLDSSNSLRTST